MKPISQVLESLLEGKFICSNTDREAYKTLKDDGQRTQINQALSALGRELQVTDRTSAYYVTYKSIGDHNRTGVKNLLANVHGIIRPIVNFIALINEANQGDSVILAGEEIKKSTLSMQIEASPELIEKLDKVYRYPKVKGNKNKETVSDKLDIVMEFLVKDGVAHLASKERQIYVMTGKIDFIYQVLDFIDTHEKIIEKVNLNEDQGDLFND